MKYRIFLKRYRFYPIMIIQFRIDIPTLIFLSKCIRLASKYVTSPENQPRSQPSTSSLRLFLTLRLPPTSTFLAKPRCNLTQPSRNTLTLPPFKSSPSSRDFRFSFSFPSLPFSFQAFTKAWPAG